MQCSFLNGSSAWGSSIWVKSGRRQNKAVCGIWMLPCVCVIDFCGQVLKMSVTWNIVVYVPSQSTVQQHQKNVARSVGRKTVMKKVIGLYNNLHFDWPILNSSPKNFAQASQIALQAYYCGPNLSLLMSISTADFSFAIEVFSVWNGDDTEALSKQLFLSEWCCAMETKWVERSPQEQQHKRWWSWARRSPVGCYLSLRTTNCCFNGIPSTLWWMDLQWHYTLKEITPGGKVPCNTSHMCVLFNKTRKEIFWKNAPV